MELPRPDTYIHPDLPGGLDRRELQEIVNREISCERFRDH
jgi:hypothetical protein